MKNYKFAILKNEVWDSHILWEKACQNFGVSYEVLDFTKNDWMEKALEKPYDCFLSRSPGDRMIFKRLYDERIYILSKVLEKKIYPTFEEILIHENKVVHAYWLKANKIPHPKTDVFYYKDEALQFLQNVVFPIVAKTQIGSTGEGIEILKSRKQAEKYVNKAFSSGIRRTFGPSRGEGNIKNRFKKNLADFEGFKRKFKNYIEKYRDAQKELVIFQEFVPHDFEWRMVRIGEFFFGHKKMKVGEKTSGTKMKNFHTPPNELLDFTEFVTEKRGFLSQAVDVFENSKGGYLINELQTFFGQAFPYQMLVEGKKGRFTKRDKKWNFEEGDFNGNECFDLRLQHVLEILENAPQKLLYGQNKY